MMVNQFLVSLLTLFFTTSVLLACGGEEPKRLRTAEPPSGVLKIADASLTVTDRDPSPLLYNHLTATTLNIGYVSQNFSFKTFASDGNFTLRQGSYTPVCAGASPTLVYLVGTTIDQLNVVQPNGRITLAPSTTYVLQVKFLTVICSSLTLDFAFQRVL